MEGDLSSLSEKLKLNQGSNVKNSDFISDVVNKQYQFVCIIEALGDILTNPDVAIRERGIDFLSWILTEIPPDLLNSQEISAVVIFYCDRLKDHHSIAPATIRGLLAIVKMKNIEKESIRQFLVPLFQEMNCQTQQQSDRYNIFSIIEYIVENHLDIVAAMGSDFVFGIISLADGETDPSNLFLLFQFLPLFLKNIDLGHLMEEMFDLLSCYFPVDYNAAAKNISITRQDLADGLMNCLSARSDFSDHCLPLICEKLDSTFKTARIDSYKLLGACCATYSVESVHNRSNELWKIIQKDVLPAVDAQICQAALDALSEIVKLFASSESERHILKDFLDDILTCIRGLLNKVDDSLFHPAINVLLAVSSKSLTAAKYVLSHLRFIFSEDAVKTEIQRKISLASLKPFLPFLIACGKSYSNEPDVSALFAEISQFHLNSATNKNREVQKLAFLGIRELIPHFNDNLRNQLLTIIAECLKKEKNCEIRVECLKILRLLGGIAPNEVLKLLETNFHVNVDSSSAASDLTTFASAISAVADVKNITQYAVPQIMNIITSSTHFDIGIRSLLNACKTVEDDSNDFLKVIHKDYGVTERLITWWVEGISECRAMDETSVENLSEIIALIVRHQEVCVQQSIVDRFVPLLLSGIDTVNNDNSGVNPLSAVVGHEGNVMLIESILGSVRQSVRLDKFPLLHSKLITLALRSVNESVRTSSSRLLASIINKSTNSALPELMCHISERIFSSLGDSSATSEKANGTRLLNWIVKGLLLANSHQLESLISKWFALLEREDVGGHVAEGFRTILKEENLYLNIKSHCNVKILYRQRFFTYFPRLMKMFQSSKESSKTNYLLALTRLIEGVPKHVTVTEIANVVLIMAQALDSGRPEVITSSLRVLSEFLKEMETILGNYAQTLIPKFLMLSRYEGSMQIRIDALKCLFYFAFYPTVALIPLKNVVVNELEACLDDKKRLVRNEAVKARSRWFLVGAPGEEAVFS